MNETTFIDLQETPEALPELPAGALNVRLLFSLALGALEVAGATPEAILTTYSDIPQLWDIPPRLANVGHIPVNVAIFWPLYLPKGICIMTLGLRAAAMCAFKSRPLFSIMWISRCRVMWQSAKAL